MRAGDWVVYLAHPEWGHGRVEWVAPDGRLVVRFDEFQDEFHAQELEMADRVAAA
jgi:hypothetical protein